MAIGVRAAWRLALLSAASTACARNHCPHALAERVSDPRTTRRLVNQARDTVDLTIADLSTECVAGLWPRVRSSKIDREWRYLMHAAAAVSTEVRGPDAAGDLLPPDDVIIRFEARADDGSLVGASEAQVAIPPGRSGSQQIRGVMELTEDQIRRLRTVEVHWKG